MNSRVDPGFFNRGGGSGEGSWYLGVEEAMGHVPKVLQFENLTYR